LLIGGLVCLFLDLGLGIEHSSIPGRTCFTRPGLQLAIKVQGAAEFCAHPSVLTAGFELKLTELQSGQSTLNVKPLQPGGNAQTNIELVNIAKTKAVLIVFMPFSFIL
jgi:hypothetical protein